jgi:HAD superfamily hydrolase (TIGR01458 family)
MDALMVDIDGVLTVGWEPLPGAVEALHRVRDAHLPIRLLTNTTSRTRASIAETLTNVGFPVFPEEILTAPALTGAYLAEHHPGRRCLLLSHGDVSADLAGWGVQFVPATAATAADLLDEPIDVVVVGGAGPEFDYQTLDLLFSQLQRGAALVAMHRNLFWRTKAGLQLDTGAFLLGLEQAAGVPAVVVGKPAPTFFESALADLDVEPANALMVGDDIEADVLSAQAAGVTGVLVRTGKYTETTLERAAGTPDHVIDSFADIPTLLNLS